MVGTGVGNINRSRYLFKVQLHFFAPSTILHPDTTACSTNSELEHFDFFQMPSGQPGSGSTWSLFEDQVRLFVVFNVHILVDR